MYIDNITIILERSLEKLISGDLKFKNLGESLPDFVKIDL